MSHMHWCFLVFVVGSVCGAPYVNFNNSKVVENAQRNGRSFNGKQCNCACGVKSNRLRVIGGEETKPHEFPWLAGLTMDGEFKCGASLLTQRHLITAAHCLHGVETSKVRVILAAHDRQRDAGQVKRRVKSAHIHEGYEPRNYNNDIAIIELDTPVDFSLEIQPVCLPSNSDGDYTGQQAIIAGWGRVEERGQLSQLLRKLEVPVWSRQDCLDKSGYQTNKITPNMFCAGFEQGGKDACQGDSGGPLHVINNAGNMEIIGLVSWGRGCARPKLPGLYTKVNNYLDWISDSLNGECLCSSN